MKWNNRVTQLLGSKYPIILGAYEGFGRSAIAAPVSEAGGFGIITAHARVRRSVFAKTYGRPKP